MKSRIFSAALLSAHTHSDDGWFRQREIRFHIELFSYWDVVRTEASPLPIHNTQIMRFLDGMAQLGLLVSNRRRTVAYKLTRAGLIDSIEQVTKLPCQDFVDDFYFLYSFLETYNQAILKNKNTQMLRLNIRTIKELSQKLSFVRIEKEQFRRIESEIKVIQKTIKDNQSPNINKIPVKSFKIKRLAKVSEYWSKSIDLRQLQTRRILNARLAHLDLYRKSLERLSSKKI